MKVIDKEADDYFEMSEVIQNEIKVLEKLPRSRHIIEYYEVRSLYSRN